MPEAVERAVADASTWVAAGGAEGFRAREDARTAVVDVPGEASEASGSSSTPRADGPDAGVGSAAADPSTRGRGPDIGEYRPWSEDPAALDRLAAQLRAHGSLVATGGCFDIVHAGHVATLQAARRLGDRLVVVMNSDASVTRLKGPGRPVVPAPDRARVLAALDCVDAVVVFDEDDPRAVLDRLRPDVWAKGGDYGGTPLPEAEVVRRHGGRVVLLPYLGGRSTTSIIQRSGLARASSTRSPA
ncbi:adenylyltransferase/cytidyltransferase family protein [Georgenia sp. SUBG003]|uniref:adenylyltransferase/cytidyltransferase family protein n=1 Tax=Georgenia sp. SUBG003 TaxID=1497974 RepID=UPI000AC2F5F7